MTLLRSAAFVGLAAAASRVTGFVRDAMIAAALGAGPVADAFLVAFRLPNLLRRIFGEGGFEAGFVPLHAKIAAERGPGAAARFAGEALSGVIVVALAVVAVVQVAAGLVVLALATGYAGDPETLALAADLTRLAFPYVAAATAAAFLGAILTAHRRPGAAALAPLAVNLVLIGALLALPAGLDAPARALWLAAAVSASGLVQLTVAAVAARGLPDVALRRPRLTPEIRRLLAVGGPALAAHAAAPLMVLAATQVASFTPSAVSWLYYAERVFQLPLGFVAVAVGLVLLPEMAAREAAGDRARFLDAQNRAIEAALLLALPAAVALSLLSGPIAVVLFERGAFGPADSAGTAAALGGLSLGLPFAVLGKVLSQSLFARARGRAALVAGGAGILVTIAAAHALSAPFGVLGLGLGTALGLAAHALALVALLRTEGLWAVDRRLVARVVRMAGACLAMAAALRLGLALWPWRAGPGLADALRLGVLCLAGLAAYAGAALALGAVTAADLRRLRTPA